MKIKRPSLMRPPRVSSSKGRGKKGFVSTLRSFSGRRSGRLIVSSLVVLGGLFLATGLFSIFATQGFTITIDRQAGPRLSASANQTVTRWWTIGPLTSASCSASTFNVPPSQRGSIGTSSRITLDTNADSGKYYCFEATDGDDNKAYRSSGLLNFAPRLVSRFVQTDTSLHSVPNLFVPITIRTIGPLSNASCSVSTFNVPPSQRGNISTSNQITLDSSDNGKYYCYELTDEWKRKTYRISSLIRIQTLPPSPDNTPPRVTVQKSQGTLRATANEVVRSWRSFGPATRASCNASTFNVPPPERSKIGTGSDVIINLVSLPVGNYYYCFEGIDSAGNKGYGYIKVVNGMGGGFGIIIQRSGNVLTATTATGVTVTWRTFGPTTSVFCAASTFNVPPSERSKIGTSARVTLDSSDNGQYYCFEATDNTNNKDYKISERVTFDTILPPPKPTDTTSPTITVEYAQNFLELSANEPIASWRSFGPQTTTSCSASTFNVSGSSLNKIGTSSFITLDSSDNGKYYCFEATDRASNKGYKISNRLNVQPAPIQLRVNVQQSGNVLTATSGNTVRSWRSFGPQTTTSCSASTFDLPVPTPTSLLNKIGSSSRITLDSSDNGKYYCFEATDHADNKGYKRSGLITYSPPEEVSIVSIVQKLRVLEVVASEGATWHYASGDCSSYASSGSKWWNQPGFKGLSARVKVSIPLTDTNHLRRLCVVASRDKGSGNTSRDYDYEQSQLLYTKPSPIKIRLRNNGTEVEAYTDESGPKDVYSWQRVGPLASSTCNKNIIDNANLGRLRRSSGEKFVTVSLDASDHNKYYCFQLLNPGGYKYWKASSKINRDVDAPAVDVARKGKTILQATSSEHVTWRRSSPLTGSTCSASVLYSNSSRDNYVSLKDSDHGKYYCFEATDRNGNKTYAVSSKIDVRGPKLNISFVSSSSGGKSLEVSADENFYLSNKSPVDSTARCRASLIPLRGNPTYKIRYAITLNQSHLNKYVCIAAYDSSGNSTYQTTRVIVSSDLLASENQINEDTSSPNTGEVDTSIVPISSSKALVGYQEALVNDTYYDNGWNGFSGDHKEQYYNHLDEHFKLYTQQQSQESLNVKITLPPKLILDGGQADIQSFVIEDFIYYTLVDRQDDCDRSIFSEQQVEQHANLSRFSLLLDPADDGKYYCFKVRLKADQRGYVLPFTDQHPYRVFVTRQPIIIDGVINEEVEAFIDVKRDSDTQTVSVAAIPKFAETINAQTWEHVQLSAEGESCGADVFDGSQQQGNTIPDDEDSYCFRVADDWGVYYYISEVDLEDFVGNSQSSLLMTVITIAGIVAGVAVVGTVAVMMTSIQKQKRNKFKF